MSEIKRILATGKSMRALAAVPSIDALRRVSENLGFELPASYIEFCQLGGLGELRLNNRVLSPDEILTSRDYAPANLVPFAGNGCGDLYCWAMGSDSEPAVVFYDHETQRFSQVASSFTDWLAKNRF